MDIKNFISAIGQIAEEKGIPKEKVIEIIERAYAAAYKKDFGKKGQIIKAKLEPETGKVKFWQIKIVVDEKMIYSEGELEELKDRKKRDESASVPTLSGTTADKEKIRFSPEKHIMLKEARKTKPKIKLEDELEIPLKTQADYGRIAAQTAKQVILQRLREAEREVVLSEYKEKEGEIISGIVQRIEGNNVYVDIGKTLGMLPREEQIPGEFYKPGQRLKFYTLKVEEGHKGPIVFLSRVYPKIISKLFEIEVPEISQGAVVIRAIAREPGSRSKIAVESKQEGVDPIGSTVGQRGIRVSAVINELNGEKIDIIEYAEESEEFIANALSPAKVLDVKIMPKNKALCLVPEDQLSLAIGKDGQNVRLAAKLTGWKIDVRSPEAAKKEAKEAKKPAKSPSGIQAGKEAKKEVKKESKKPASAKKATAGKKAAPKKTKTAKKTK